MINIGIFFGSDTGNTENIAKLLQQQLGVSCTKVHDIAQSSKKDIEQYQYLLFGIPTWYYGEAQCDWDDFFSTLKKINFSGKTVAIFGCGDQEDYTDYFCDAMGIMHNIVVYQGAKIIGYWPIDGYYFESSKGLADKKHFVGLAIDEDRQPELTKERVNSWVQQILKDLN